VKNIYDRMLDHMKQNPGEAVAYVSKPDAQDKAAQDHAWEMWQAYFERTGNQKTLRAWKSHLATGGKGLTFPCASPDQFDRAYAGQRSPRSRYGYE
jgi:hypothetical protein